jgi:hypothetical protein
MTIANGYLANADDLLGWGVRNHVRNGSFELTSIPTGSSAPPPGWELFSTPTLSTNTGVVDGAYGPQCLKVIAGDPTQGVQQVLTHLRPDTTYTVWARYVVSTDGAAVLQTSGAASGEELNEVGYSTSWTILSGHFVTDSSGSDVTLLALAGGPGDIAYFDDAMVVEGVAVRPWMPHPGDILRTIFVYPNSKDFAEMGVFSFWPYDDLAGQATYFTWCMPDDFYALVEVAVVGIADATETIQADLYSEYGASGEAYNAHAESALDQQLAVTINKLYGFSVLGVLSSVAGGDHITLKFFSDTTILYPVGLKVTFI